MSFQKFKSNFFCVGHKGYFSTKNIVGEITFEKTGRRNLSLVGKCSITSCNRKKTMIVSDNAIEVEGLGDFFQEAV